MYTTDFAKAVEIASKIRTGTYAVNMYAFDPGAPFGGYKNSGIGRENGPEGIDALHPGQERAAAVWVHAGVNSWGHPSNKPRTVPEDHGFPGQFASGGPGDGQPEFRLGS